MIKTIKKPLIAILSTYKKYIFRALVFLVLILSITPMPNHSSSNDHDSASQAGYEYWTKNGFLYGSEIIQNIGPLGFLNYPSVYTGFLDQIKFFLILILTILFIILVIDSSKKLPKAINILFITLLCIFANGDAFLYFFISLISYKFIITNKLSSIIIFSIFLGFIALTKGTFLFISIFILFASIFTNLFLLKWIFATVSAITFLLSFIFFWKLSSQEIDNISDFFYGMVSFSNGANEAMAFYEQNNIIIAGLLSLLTYLICLIANSVLINQYKNPEVLKKCIAITITQIFIIFVVWKHGFVRADEQHTAIFFQYCLIAITWITFNNLNFSVFRLLNENALKIIIIYLSLVIFFIYAFFGLSYSYSINPSDLLINKFNQIENNFNFIFNSKKKFNQLEESLNQNISLMRLPEVQATVASGKITYFGIHPGPVFYNNLNYISTPSTISFASWNNDAMNKDALFFRNDINSPEYILLEMQSIDNRLPAQDSSLAQLEILHRYKVLNYEKNNFLLKRIYNKENISFEILKETYSEVNKLVNIKDINSDLVWVAMKFDQNLLTKLINFLYKPSSYNIEFTFDDGKTTVYKFVPKMAETGFLINPLIANNLSFLEINSSLWRSEFLGARYPIKNKVAAFKITCNNIILYCPGNYDIKYYKIKGLSFSKDQDVEIDGALYSKIVKNFNIDQKR